MKIFAVLSLAFALSTPALFAQFETSEVLGTIKDASGAPVPNVSVTLKNDKTGIESKVLSDGSGNYDFFDVKIGSYSITAKQNAGQQSRQTADKTRQDRK